MLLGILVSVPLKNSVTGVFIDSGIDSVRLLNASLAYCEA
jgi:hypothetical protein